MPASGFADRVLAWARRHGRTGLPWQRRPTPYRVWVSEIMLQQTRVATAVAYYRRFMARFPSLRALAAADLDQVLAAWSGLGYYARGRNLHRAAQVVATRHGGRMPRTLEGLVSLPGIGRSTAAAILSLAAGQRHAILDGNVKRVLCRHAGVAGWPGAPAVQRELWALAEARLPNRDAARYTQGMMDLGATVCTARNPACGDCPVAADCVALREDRVGELPATRRRAALPERETTFLLVRDPGGDLLLVRRPASGIWGGLWCFPECPTPDRAVHLLTRLGLSATPAKRDLAAVRHTFSHFRLTITPLLLDLAGEVQGVRDDGGERWVAPHAASGIGLAAPVSRLLACVGSLS